MHIFHYGKWVEIPDPPWNEEAIEATLSGIDRRVTSDRDWIEYQLRKREEQDDQRQPQRD